MYWKEKMVDKLIERMKDGEETIYFSDDDIFGESMFDACAILRDKVRILNDLIYVGSYVYRWEGDSVGLVATKEELERLWDGETEVQ